MRNTKSPRPVSIYSRGARFFLALSLTAGMVLAIQALAITEASAGSVPPPASCGTGSTYKFGDPQCWGTAGNPPPGCLNGNTVNQSQNCLLWQSDLPQQAQSSGASGCKNGQIQGPLGSCCDPTDTQCLNGSQTTPQGDPKALALAKQVCADIKNLKGVNPGNIPFDCSNTQPTLDAGMAACQAAEGSNSTNTQSPIWLECAQLTVAVAGEVPPTNPPLGSDPQTAKQACQALQNAGITPPAGCNGGNPSVQDGVAACKALVTSSAAQGLSGQPIIAACLSLITRNPMNVGQTTTTQVISTTFNDADIKKLSSGLTFFALIVCVGGIFVSSAMWAMGAKGQSEGQQHAGKRGLIVCLVAALILGALPPIMTYLDVQSRLIDRNGVTNN